MGILRFESSKRMRVFLASCMAVACTGMQMTPASGAEPAKYRLGVLILGEPGQNPDMAAFFQELAQRGLVEGRNLFVERRYAKSFNEQVDVAAHELVALKPDVIFTSCGFRCAQAAKRQTTTIPIVFDAAGNPLAQGLTDDLARPTGNLTGSAVFGVELDMKRLELLREAAVKAREFVMLQAPMVEERRSALRSRLAAFDKANQVHTELVEVSGRDDLPKAFDAMEKRRVEGLVIAASPLMNLYCPYMAELALKHRLAATGDVESCIDAGMLLVYKIDFAEVYRQSGTYVHSLLLGAKVADLPIVHASRFNLIVNLKTAKALGLAVPDAMLHRADRVIE